MIVTCSRDCVIVLSGIDNKTDVSPNANIWSQLVSERALIGHKDDLPAPRLSSADVSATHTPLVSNTALIVTKKSVVSVLERPDNPEEQVRPQYLGSDPEAVSFVERRLYLRTVIVRPSDSQSRRILPFFIPPLISAKMPSPQWGLCYLCSPEEGSYI
jgi:hypothetical protein